MHRTCAFAESAGVGSTGLHALMGTRVSRDDYIPALMNKFASLSTAQISSLDRIRLGRG